MTEGVGEAEPKGILGPEECLAQLGCRGPAPYSLRTNQTGGNCSIGKKRL